MPGARYRNKPGTADEFPACNEESQLELHLQRQLEEDVARIFDESIYSDLEVVCGKLKVLTHSCILKARTHKFYHKLHTILHVNIERSTFDEIYSFISDVYTECNIQHEEKEIIAYLDSNLHLIESVKSKLCKKEDTDELEVFLTPKCITPYVENGVTKLINSSPSTDLTKEYYALVPIDGQLLEKELIEQDALSNAFNSIIKAQKEEIKQVKVVLRNKPTSLSLTSSHTSKTVKHSSSCDILNKTCLKHTTSSKLENIKDTVPNKDSKTNQTNAVSSQVDDNTVNKNANVCNLFADKTLDAAYSPDSLITDEPSSSSDYLSAAYTFSPGVSSSGGLAPVNVGNITSKMEHIYTLSDSGLDDTAMLGSINSHKDITLTNVSLSENTLPDFVAEDASISAVSIPSSLAEKTNSQITYPISSENDCNGQNSCTSIGSEVSGKSLKEEKQRQNEEIVILESSSLSSETGSWESVYPPKFVGKEICEKFLRNERQQWFSQDRANKSPESELPSSLVQKSPFKSTACFIDASSLVDEEDVIRIENGSNDSTNVRLEILPVPSQPVPCSTAKADISPNDWSESNDNEDSLEQVEKKDQDSIQKDLSPTIFEMTPITEDSLCANTFENAVQSEQDKVQDLESNSSYMTDRDKSHRSSTMFISSTTPNNSIMSLKTYKQYESEDSESINTVVGSEDSTSKEKRGSCSPPILSGGVSVEDHLPHVGSSHESSPLPKFKLENVPIVTGAYLPQVVDSTQNRTRTSSASAWVVDMSVDTKVADSKNSSSKNSEESINEKKNIFSMYIDLGEKSTLKDMPTRLSSSMNTKKNVAHVESKPVSKQSRTVTNIVERNVPKDKINESVTIFEKYESLCNDPTISISEIIAIPEKQEPIPEVSENTITEIVSEIKQTRVVVENKNKIQKEEIQIQKEPTVDQPKDLFVKLSDLDKPVRKSDMSFTTDSKEIDVRMTRSIPDSNWADPSFSTNSRSIEVISSFHSENALSLNRLFPHLKNEFSRSMPGSLSSRTRSPLRLGTSSTLGDADEQVSDMSEISSMQCSNCHRSGFGNSTTDSQTSSLIDDCISRLGQDLLRMFLEEIAPDVIVEVSGKRFKAHKCILSSRCQYFAGILSGGWVESLGNVIVLPPFSYDVVYFALCHIYSGLATIPDTVSIVELATIADMLGLEGLKEAIMFKLKAKYCHHFHKPCAVCVVGVLECFPLSSVYGLDDLYHKCLKWITKHFSTVWPTKAFATLPTDLLVKCYQDHLVNLTVDNLVETMYGCGITAASLHNSRWADSVARMCRRLVNAAANFAAPRLVEVFIAITPLPSEAPHAAKQALEECISAAIEWAPPEEACRAYGFLSAIIKELPSQHYSKPDLISNGTESHKSFGPNNFLHTHAGSWRLQCESALVRASPRVVTTQAFKNLPSDLRKRLRELGCIKYGAHALAFTHPRPFTDKKTRHNIVNNKNNKVFSTTGTRSVDIAQVRASFVPYSTKPVIPGSMDTLKSNNDLRDFKKQLPATHPPKVRTTKAQEERAKFNKTKNTKSQDRLNSKTVTARAPSFENTKPRYLEPKNSKDKRTVVNKHLPKIESSSESSRNSSPIHLRNLRSSPQKGRRIDKGERRDRDAQTMSQDSLATSSRPRTAEPSTDSLSESQTSNKYATYTKTKHIKGSIESIKTARCPDNIRSTPSNKMKTKIPVYLNQTPKTKATSETRNSRDSQKRCMMTSKIEALNRPAERKVPGSLMMATKSSSAKMVPKVIKEPANSKNMTKSQRASYVRRHQHEDKEFQVKDIPTMERSGTFLKDEPTFGDKTTSIDIDQ